MPTNPDPTASEIAEILQDLQKETMASTRKDRQDGTFSTPVLAIANAKKKATARLSALMARERIATAQTILNTSRYADRPLSISVLAVEQLIEDLKAGSDKHKVISAINKASARLDSGADKGE